MRSLAWSAEQCVGEIAGAWAELPKSAFEFVGADAERSVGRVISGKQRGAAQTLANECRADAFKRVDERLGHGSGKLEAFAIELDQPSPAFSVRERQFDRLVDPAGPGGEGRFAHELRQPSGVALITGSPTPRLPGGRHLVDPIW